MIRKRSFKRRPTAIFVKANQQIRYPEVRVLSERGEMVGLMPIHQALAQAQAENKDLVLVTESAKPPITKIIELAKYKYQLQQKASENRKKNKAQEIKELQFTPFIGEGDLQTKLKRVFEFLNHGDKVRLTVDFRRGRQITKKEFGFEVLNKIFAATADIASVEMQPQFVGKKLITQLMPLKKGKAKPQVVTAASIASPQAESSVPAPEAPAEPTNTATDTV